MSARTESLAMDQSLVECAVLTSHLCRPPDFLWNSYARAIRARSISYAVKPFYGAKEEVMFGLLLMVLIGLALVGAFIAYEHLTAACFEVASP